MHEPSIQPWLNPTACAEPRNQISGLLTLQRLCRYFAVPRLTGTGTVLTILDAVSQRYLACNMGLNFQLKVMVAQQLEEACDILRAVPHAISEGKE